MDAHLTHDRKRIWGNKRPKFRRTYNWRKRSRLTSQNIFPQRSSSGDSVFTSALLNGSLQRSPFFTAPISTGDEQLQVIHIVNPSQYPGWRLYFSTANFEESAHLVVQIKAFEKHVIDHPNIYVLSEIRKHQRSNICIKFLMTDNVFVSSWTNFIQQIQETPDLVISCLGLAMHSLVTAMTIESTVSRESLLDAGQYRSRKVSIRKIDVRPVEFFPVNSITDITPESYDKLFVVHGRVSRNMAVETKCTWVAFKCRRCGHEQSIRQGEHYPTKPLRCRIQCNSKRNFIELRSSPYTTIDRMQIIQLHEVGLQCQVGSPLRIDIVLQNDLIDLVCPGSEITVTGVLKIKSLDIGGKQKLQQQTKDNAYIRAVAVVNHTISEKSLLYKPTQKDLEIVQMIKREPNCLRLLVQSFAPEMCGHEMLKVAVLLLLFGGSGSQLHDEGELHVLMVGDPGVGKSRLLQNAANISEIGELVSGKCPASSVVTNQQVKMPIGLNTGNFIDTGFILTSHAGHCCIDDIDRLSSNQETLIHIMQTKSVVARSTTIAFNVVARNSVLATVNPVRVHYDSSKLLCENVRMSPPLLSLFHLVFVVFDKADKDRDNMLTKHVNDVHTGMKKVISIPTKYSMDLKANDYILENEDIELNERLKVACGEHLDLLPQILLKKYIAYARQTSKPLLTKEAADEIKDFYLGLRNERNDERFPITSRQLDGLIRLTQARAKIELCLEATKKHTRDVIELFRHSYAHTSVVELNSTLNEEIAGTSHLSKMKKFIQVLQLRSNALGRKVFEFEELNDMALHAGMKCDVTNLVELVNMQGYLLKKGPNLYEYRTQ